LTQDSIFGLCQLIKHSIQVQELKKNLHFQKYMENEALTY